MSDRDQIAALLADRAELLARELVPDGLRSGHYWIGRCPWRTDKRAGSFWINLAGAKVPGSFRDEATDESGGPIDLVMKARDLDFKGAMAWSRDWLGLGNASTAAVRAKADAARANAQAHAVDHDAQAEKNARGARAIYLEARRRPFLGSPADFYLQRRGIFVARLPKVPGVLGWLPQQRHMETGTTWTAMVAGFQTDAGETVAVHRTFLAKPEGSHLWGKAPVTPARKIWPSFTGCAIRLWRGDSGLSVADAIKHGVRERLVLTEGVEDGLAVALSDPVPRVWCAGSLSNLGALQIPACIDEVVVCADNDWGKRQATMQLNRAITALARQVPRVLVARSHFGKDANDALLSAQEG